jgi:hypothetical protein
MQLEVPATMLSRFNLLEGLDAEKIKLGRTLDRDVWRGKKGSQLAERYYGRRSGENGGPNEFEVVSPKVLTSAEEG